MSIIISEWFAISETNQFIKLPLFNQQIMDNKYNGWCIIVHIHIFMKRIKREGKIIKNRINVLIFVHSYNFSFLMYIKHVSFQLNGCLSE